MFHEHKEFEMNATMCFTICLFISPVCFTICLFISPDLDGYRAPKGINPTRPTRSRNPYTKPPRYVRTKVQATLTLQTGSIHHTTALLSGEATSASHEQLSTGLSANFVDFCESINEAGPSLLSSERANRRAFRQSNEGRGQKSGRRQRGTVRKAASQIPSGP